VRRSALRLRPSLATFVFAAALAACLPAAAGQGARRVHDARYCEVFELRGAPPEAKVLVWNTIGLNDCPAETFDALDTAQLAAERGDTAVILNGPRHFLMDVASGRTGAIHSFGGLRTRRVATIPITSAADLAQTPYTERTIKRHNVWHWRKGRRVFQLLAPDGSTYVMQSYAQIVDPAQTLADLGSLGERLDLPRGWRYRVRRLGKPFDLTARHSATIIQDDLRNTYQQVPRKADDTSSHAVDLSGLTKTVGSPQPGALADRGTITGTPFGPGKIRLVASFGPGQRITGPFTIRTAKGAVFGNFDAGYAIAGSEITFDGSAELTGGTNYYRGIRGHDLTAHDHNTLDGQNGTFTLVGDARY
jgi:hypothetical protein